MEDYAGNSKKSKAVEKEKPEAVTTNVTVKKKSFGQKLMGSMIAQDTTSVGTYIFEDVLVPALKEGLLKVIINGAEMMFYGETTGRSSRRDDRSRVSYRSYYDDKPRRREDRVSVRTTYDFDDIIFNSRVDAEAVLTQMDDILDRYDVVTVQDFFGLAGITGKWTDDKYGWTSLRNATITRVRDGFMIKMPRPMPID